MPARKLIRLVLQDEDERLAALRRPNQYQIDCQKYLEEVILLLEIQACELLSVLWD